MFTMKLKVTKDEFDIIVNILKRNHSSIDVADDCGVLQVYQGMEHISAYDVENELLYCSDFLVVKNENPTEKR